MPSVLCIFMWWLNGWDSCSQLCAVSFDLHTRARDVSVNRTGTCDVSWDSCHDRNVTFGIADRSNVIPGWHVSWGLFLHFLIQSQSLFNPAPPVCSGYYLCVICLFLCLFVCVLVFLYACAVSEVVFPSGGGWDIYDYPLHQCSHYKV